MMNVSTEGPPQSSPFLEPVTGTPLSQHCKGCPLLHQIHIKVLLTQPSQNLENLLGSFLVYFNKEISYLAPTKRGKRFTFT